MKTFTKIVEQTILYNYGKYLLFKIGLVFSEMTKNLKVVGVTGYINTPDGPRSIKTVWAARLSDEVRRRFYRNWFSSKKKAFTKASKKYESEDGKKSIDRDLALLKKVSFGLFCIQL